MAFPLLFGLMGLGSLFTKGALSTGLAAASTAKSVYDQINLSDPTLKESALAAVPCGAAKTGRVWSDADGSKHCNILLEQL